MKTRLPRSCLLGDWVEGRREEAGRFAGAISGLLLAAAGLALAGMLLALRRRLPAFDLPWRDDLRMILLALAAAAPAAFLWRFLPLRPGLLAALPVLAAYGLAYPSPPTSPAARSWPPWPPSARREGEPGALSGPVSPSGPARLGGRRAP